MNLTVRRQTSPQCEELCEQLAWTPPWICPKQCMNHDWVLGHQVVGSWPDSPCQWKPRGSWSVRSASLGSNPSPLHGSSPVTATSSLRCAWVQDDRGEEACAPLSGQVCCLPVSPAQGRVVTLTPQSSPGLCDLIDLPSAPGLAPWPSQKVCFSFH